MIDFSIPASLDELAARVGDFVNENIVPFERDERITAHGPTDELRTDMQALAKAAGLFAPQLPKDLGGMGLSHVEQAVVFEAAGWSTFGPIALNCAAPDEANMYLLGRIASAEQVDRFVRPVTDGRWRSAFAMTEPGGAGSDPGQLTTTAQLDGDDYVISGKKWLISGAVGAGTWIIMANVPAMDTSPGGPTLFLVPGGTDGINIERQMNTMDRNFVEGHAVVTFDGLRVPATDILGEVGQALRYAQMRLGPARLTHGSRWLGAAARAQSIATEWAKTRTAFGKPIGQHEGVGFMLAKNEIAIEQCRLSIWRTAWLLDQGNTARHESSIAKAFVSEELFNVVDRCVQVLGGIGVTEETPISTIYRDIRAFRLYDGPTEVHLYAIARQILR